MWMWEGEMMLPISPLGMVGLLGQWGHWSSSLLWLQLLLVIESLILWCCLLSNHLGLMMVAVVVGRGFWMVVVDWSVSLVSNISPLVLGEGWRRRWKGYREISMMMWGLLRIVEDFRLLLLYNVIPANLDFGELLRLYGFIRRIKGGLGAMIQHPVSQFFGGNLFSI